MFLNSRLQELIGRKIIGVVAMEGNCHLRRKINLVQDDGTYLEIYGNDVNNAKGGWPGGYNAARNTEEVHGIVPEFGEV